MRPREKPKMRLRTRSRTFEQSGFSVIQLLLTVVLISIVSAFALLQVSSTRARLSLQNSVRQLATYIERARMDAIRRHATTSDMFSSTVVAGSAVHDNSLDCSTGPVGSEEPGPPLTGTGPGGCTLSVDPSSKSIKKNGGTTATITVGTNIATTITVSAPVNLQVSPTTRGMSAGGSGTFSISSLNSTRGTFAVNFTSTCTTDTVLIKVTN